jgi:hypothetical protein
MGFLSMTKTSTKTRNWNQGLLPLLAFAAMGVSTSGCGSGLLSAVDDGAAGSGSGGGSGGGSPGGNGGFGGSTAGADGPGSGGSSGAHWQQVGCLVSRTECSGWVENDSNGLDGLDVNCPTGNLVPNGPFTATICYQTAVGSTFEQQRADAQNACDQYCGFGFTGLYPLGSVANKGGTVTCLANAQNDTIVNEAAGQCLKTKTSTGATTFALCTLSGRTCESPRTAADGTQYCTSMRPVPGGQSTSGCFDSTVTTAEELCQNGFKFPTVPVGASNTSDQFHFWQVDQVELNATEADCQAEANSI